MSNCYRKGGCGPYEMRPCNECPASKPEYLQLYEQSSIKDKTQINPYSSTDALIAAISAVFRNRT